MTTCLFFFLLYSPFLWLWSTTFNSRLQCPRLWCCLSRVCSITDSVESCLSLSLLLCT